jgi:phosphomannomutase
MRRLIAATKGDHAELIEGVRVHMGDDWVAAIPDADRATFHVVAEAAHRDRAQRLAEEFRDRITGWRKEPA